MTYGRSEGRNSIFLPALREAHEFWYTDPSPALRLEGLGADGATEPVAREE